jgi:glutamate-ammonia-ligase adenylyltransferase
VVAGPPKLRARIAAAIRHAIAAGPRAAILADAAAMRVRLLRDHPPAGFWDVKHRPGGQIEVEFIAQTAQLLHGPVSSTLRLAVAGLRDAGAMSGEDAELLIRADRLWRTVQGQLRITEGPRPPAQLSEAVDLDGLRATLDALAHDVRAAFIRLVGAIES